MDFRLKQFWTHDQCNKYSKFSEPISRIKMVSTQVRVIHFRKKNWNIGWNIFNIQETDCYLLSNDSFKLTDENKLMKIK